MNDTSARVAQLVAERHDVMSPQQRMQIASSMYETARTIIESSLPAGLTREQRRYAIVKRLYGDELPESALRAHANFSQETNR
jgi:hypothetical protein